MKLVCYDFRLILSLTLFFQRCHFVGNFLFIRETKFFLSFNFYRSISLQFDDDGVCWEIKFLAFPLRCFFTRSIFMCREVRLKEFNDVWCMWNEGRSGDFDRFVAVWKFYWFRLFFEFEWWKKFRWERLKKLWRIFSYKEKLLRWLNSFFKALQLHSFHELWSF